MTQRSKLNITQLIFAGVLVIFVAGCATQSSVVPSGFLGDYSKLQPSQVYEGLYFDASSGVPLESYKSFIVDPVLVYIRPDANGAAVDPVKLKELSDYFRDEIIMELSDGYDVVDEPGPGVLRIRAAITDVVANKVAFNLHWSTTLAGYGLGGASIEADFLDSQTDQRVLAVKDAKTGSRVKYQKGLTKWGHTKGVLTAWVKMFKEHIDKIHGRIEE